MQVQKVQSERATGSATKAPKKSKNSSAADVGTISREDLPDERAKMETRCAGEAPPKQQEQPEAKEHKDGVICDYLRPLTDFQRAEVTLKAPGEEGGGHVRCYSTYWCFSEPTNEESGGGGGADRNIREGATRSDSRLERERASPTGDCAAAMNCIRSESALKKVTLAKEEPKDPSAATPPAPVYEEIIFFNDKLLADEAHQSSAVFFTDYADDEEEEIEELERLRRLDERQSTDENEDETDVAPETAEEVCGLERRAGVTDIKNSSTDAAVQDWCEDLQQFFTRTRRRQLAEDAERLTGTERINVDDWKQFAAKELNAAPGKDDPEDKIQVLHCDDRDTTATVSSEFCVRTAETTTEKTVETTVATEIVQDSPENVSLFSDIPTIDAVEHLVKSTILNEDSERFLDDIQKQQQQPQSSPLEEEEEEQQQQHASSRRVSSKYTANGRILIRKTDDPIEDEFIKKKPTRTGDSNRKRWRGEKAINWKLYMAHRCLQLSDHMNVDDHGGAKSGRTMAPPSLSVTKKTTTPSTCKEGDFRRKRSNNQGEDNLRDSYRYTGLRFEEYEGTVNIEEVIANVSANDERRPNSVARERMCVFKDEETTCVDAPSRISEQVKLSEWQTYVEEGIDNSKRTREDCVVMVTDRPKSFLESIDIRDFVGPEICNAPAESVEEESAKHIEKETKDSDKNGEQSLPIENRTVVEVDLLEMYDFDASDIWNGEPVDSFETKMEDEGFSETTVDIPARSVIENKESEVTQDSGFSCIEREETINVVEFEEKSFESHTVEKEVETGGNEEPRSEEQTTVSVDKSDEYHDADLVAVDDKDEEETTETVFYDTESESSVGEDELASSKKDEDDLLTPVECDNPPMVGKKDASQKSVHFQIGDEVSFKCSHP